jgi:hypothetical protein
MAAHQSPASIQMNHASGSDATIHGERIISFVKLVLTGLPITKTSGVEMTCPFSR